MKEYKEGLEENWPDKVVIYTDGASRGNPGDASLGLAVYDSSNKEVFCYAQALGTQTNNYAEYMAVVKALNFSVENNVKNVIVRSDSQLLVRQIQGQYKVKSAGLKPLFLDCKGLIGKLPEFKIEHVRREDNVKADELANHVLDI